LLPVEANMSRAGRISVAGIDRRQRRTAMLQTSGVEGVARVAPCPGLVGVVRDTCLACGRCDDVIRDRMRGIAAPSVKKQPDAPTRAPV
jgi:hypothetical protein